MRMIGKIVAGKAKITTAQSDSIFAAMLNGEYEPPVERGMLGAKQHEFDAAYQVPSIQTTKKAVNYSSIDQTYKVK